MFHSRRALIAASRRPFVAAGGGWTPASVSTDVWYDASNAATITSSGGLVSQWNDLSGNARHATQSNNIYKFTDTASVQNGKHGLLSIREDGSGNASFMQIPSFTRNMPFMMFFAVKITTLFTSQYAALYDNDVVSMSGNRVIVFADNEDGSGDHQAMLTASTQAAKGGSVLSNNTPYYFSCVFDGASSKMRKNGTQVSTSNTITSGGISGSLSGMLGAWASADGFPGYWLEFFIIPTNSTTDMTNAESYLATKWSIP
jgi:hypothetical protein